MGGLVGSVYNVARRTTAKLLCNCPGLSMLNALIYSVYC